MDDESKNIVVVVEDVEASKTALQWALHNLLRYGDVLTLLHVFPGKKMKKKHHRLLRLKGYQLALAFKELCSNFFNTRIEIVVAEDDDRQEGGRILALVREIGAFALVVGLHDHSFLYNDASFSACPSATHLPSPTPPLPTQSPLHWLDSFDEACLSLTVSEVRVVAIPASFEDGDEGPVHLLLCLVGMPFTNNNINAAAMTNTLCLAWHPEHGPAVKDVGGNRFAFHFFVIGVLQNYTSSSTIGYKFGDFVDVDSLVPVVLGRPVRIRVMIDRVEPLVRRISHGLVEINYGVGTQYERLPIFSFCGRLGHQRSSASVAVEDVLYGEWLHVLNFFSSKVVLESQNTPFKKVMLEGLTTTVPKTTVSHAFGVPNFFFTNGNKKHANYFPEEPTSTTCPSFYYNMVLLFYQRFWGFIGPDVINFVNNWWDGRASIAGINKTVFCGSVEAEALDAFGTVGCVLWESFCSWWWLMLGTAFRSAVASLVFYGSGYRRAFMKFSSSSVVVLLRSLWIVPFSFLVVGPWLVTSSVELGLPMLVSRLGCLRGCRVFGFPLVLFWCRLSVPPILDGGLFSLV